MAHSHVNLIYHLVFATKGRYPWLEPTIAARLHPYLGGAVRNEGGSALIINGTADHVHLLVNLRQDAALSDVVRAVKANSSKWIHQEFRALEKFAWQSGYGAFTVSTSQLERVRAYIANQQEHHRHKTFEEEYVAMLEANGIEFDRRYVFD